MVEAAPNLVIVMNSEKVLEYFRQRSLSEHQTDDLDRIDAKLEQGFQVGGDFIKQPSAEDKAMFMANMLIHALTTKRDSLQQAENDEGAQLIDSTMMIIDTSATAQIYNTNGIEA